MAQLNENENEDAMINKDNPTIVILKASDQQPDPRLFQKPQSGLQTEGFKETRQFYRGPLEGFQPKRKIALETKSVAAAELESKLTEDIFAPKSEFFGEHGRLTQETFDIGKPDIFEESPERQFLNKTKKGAQTEMSSVYARDTGDLLHSTRKHDRELFDVERDFVANSESGDNNKRYLEDGTRKTQNSDAQKVIKERPKNKTDTFLVSSLGIEAEKPQRQQIINTDLRRMPDRGGSHNFNLLSQSNTAEGDFEIEQVAVAEISQKTNPKPIFDIPENHNSSDEEDRSSNSKEERRDAGEVDFDF